MQTANGNAELSRARRMAGAALAAVTLLFIAARVFEAGRPGLSYVAAFAEAAMIGALADWFAVAALFGRPLGIPIWHTDILRRRKPVIADKLGEFVQSRFLSAEGIREKIREFDPARTLARWLLAPSSAENAPARRQNGYPGETRRV